MKYLKTVGTFEFFVSTARLPF